MNVLIFTAPALLSIPTASTCNWVHRCLSVAHGNRLWNMSASSGLVHWPTHLSALTSCPKAQIWSCHQKSSLSHHHLSFQKNACLKNIVKSEYSPSSSFWNKYYVKVSPSALPFPSSPHNRRNCLLLLSSSALWVFFISILILIYLEPHLHGMR